jgi:hypothetical protein
MTYFNIESLVKEEKREFKHFIFTDKISVSILILCKKLSQEEKKKIYSLKNQVVTLSPGRKSILTVIIYKKKCIKMLQKLRDKNVKYKFIQ